MDDENKLKLTFIGDLLCHYEFMDLCRLENGKYDFDTPISKIKKYFDVSDYVIGNLETPIGERDARYIKIRNSLFNSPPEYLETFIDAGVDLFLTGNNHAYDDGEIGLLRTLETLNKYNLDHTGTWYSQEDASKPFIKQIKGIKIAFLNYTYGTNYYKRGVLPPPRQTI